MSEQEKDAEIDRLRTLNCELIATLAAARTMLEIVTRSLAARHPEERR